MRINVTDLFKVSRELPSSIMQVLRYYGEDIILGGECLSKILRGEPVEEYDIYLKDTTSIEPADIIDYLEEYEQFLPYKVKFIIKPFKYPYDLLDEMDFTIESVAMMYENGSWNLHCHDDFYVDNLGKRVRCLGNVGLSALLKVMDYKNRGYSINNPELSKILAGIIEESEIDEEESKTGLMLRYIEMLDTIKPDYE